MKGQERAEEEAEEEKEEGAQCYLELQAEQGGEESESSREGHSSELRVELAVDVRHARTRRLLLREETRRGEDRK